MSRVYSILPIAMILAFIISSVIIVAAINWATQPTAYESKVVGGTTHVESFYEKYKEIIWAGSGKGSVKEEPLAAPSGG